MGSKGFVMTLDASLAVIIMAIFLLSFSFFYAQIGEDTSSLMAAEKQANDLLIVMDKNGTLATLDPEAIDGNMDLALHEGFSKYLEVEYYNYSNGFYLAGNFSVGSNYTESEKTVFAQREFLVFDNQSIKHYGIARLRLWAK